METLTNFLEMLTKMADLAQKLEYRKERIIVTFFGLAGLGLLYYIYIYISTKSPLERNIQPWNNYALVFAACTSNSLYSWQSIRETRSINMLDYIFFRLATAANLPSRPTRRVCSS
jgi:ABC-type uncharacterized transport system permease subunit